MVKYFLASLIVSVALTSLVTADAPGEQTVRAVLTAIKDRPAVASFRLANAAGKFVRPSDFRGRPVVINLWATDCGGCRAELPAFVHLDRVYRAKGLTVVGVSMDVMYSDLKNSQEAWARVKPFARTHGMRYPLLVDDGSVETGFKVTALPATYLVDRGGRIAATYIGVVDTVDLEANIKTLMNERQ